MQSSSNKRYLRAVTAIPFLALVLSLALPGGLSAQEEKLSREDEAVLAGLASRYRGLETLKAEYIRSTVTPSSDPVFKNQASQTAVGTLYWRKPFNLRLDQISPAKEEMVVDGTTAWWYIPREKTAHVVRDLDLDSEYYSLMSLFDGMDELRLKFRVSPIPEGEGRGVMKGFVLTALEDRGPGSIVIFCDNSQKLQGFRLSSATGERTDFFLNYLSPNAELEPDLFDFNPPRGTDVVEDSAQE